MTDKNILVVYSNTNTGKKHDATGAFIPEAKAFAKVHSVPDKNVVGLKFPRVKKAVRREQFYRAIADAAFIKPLDAIAFFGHGWPRGLQCGVNREHVPELVRHMSHYCKKDVRVTLYACLAAENDVKDKHVKNLGPATDGGFCDVLRDEMVLQGLDQCTIDGHKTFGHSSWNPYIVRFLGSEVDDARYGAEGGAWLVAPFSQMWRKWCKALKDQKNNLRYVFPFMDETDIKAELLGAKVIQMDTITIIGQR